ncbi:MAG: hypothetical protein VB068_07500 [Petrimonas sp.]|nr:hypothetical protein [Petrimonas sp.]
MSNPATRKDMIGYKYRSFDDDKNIKAIAENYIWASGVESLNDPHELSSEFNVEKELGLIKRVFSVPPESEKEIKSNIDGLSSRVTKVGVYSWINILLKRTKRICSTRLL